MCQRNKDIDTTYLKNLAETIGLKLDFDSPQTRAGAATTLFNECAWLSTKYLLEKAQSFLARQKGQWPGAEENDCSA